MKEVLFLEIMSGINKLTKVRRCPNGHTVGDDMRFCPICGTEISSSEICFCPNCGTKRLLTDKFCSNCGLLSHYKSFKLRKKYLDHPAFYFYFTFGRGFSKAIIRPQFGGKPVPYEWYDPSLFVRHSNSPGLPRNWYRQLKKPVNIPNEERNALQFLADNYLI